MHISTTVWLRLVILMKKYFSDEEGLLADFALAQLKRAESAPGIVTDTGPYNKLADYISSVSGGMSREVAAIKYGLSGDELDHADSCLNSAQREIEKLNKSNKRE